MDLKQAGSSLDALVSSFQSRIVELQEVVIARNSSSSLFPPFFDVLREFRLKRSSFCSSRAVYPTTSMPDLSALDTTLKTMESQIQAIKERLQEERNVIPKAKVSLFLHPYLRLALTYGLVPLPSFLLVLWCRNSSSCPNDNKESCSICSLTCPPQCLRAGHVRITIPPSGNLLRMN